MYIARSATNRSLTWHVRGNNFAGGHVFHKNGPMARLDAVHLCHPMIVEPKCCLETWLVVGTQGAGQGVAYIDGPCILVTLILDTAPLLFGFGLM